MSKTKKNETCEPNPKDPRPTHECEHGRSVPNRPGDQADRYRKQTGHY